MLDRATRSGAFECYEHIGSTELAVERADKQRVDVRTFQHGLASRVLILLVPAEPRSDESAPEGTSYHLDFVLGATNAGAGPTI